MILDNDLQRGKPPSEAIIRYGNGNVGYESDGNIAGIQFAVSGTFEITENYLPAGWAIDYNENTRT